MEGYGLRLLCAAAVFLMAGLSPAMLSVREEEPAPTAPAAGWYVSVGSQVLLPGDQVVFYDRDGQEADRQTADADGDLAAGPLAPGEYSTWQERLGTVRFRLEENGAVTALEGNGWADGERLWLTEGPVSSLRVTVGTERLMIDGRLLTLTLEQEDGITRQQSVYISLDSQAVNGVYTRTCLFDGLPPGLYVLRCEGVSLELAVHTRPVECALDVP